MKKLACLILSLCTLAAQAQKSTDPQLNSRLNDYLLATRQLDLNKLMDYMHPKLFTIVPKEQLVQSMEQAFNAPEMKFTFDSTGIIAISAPYKFGKTTYRKIDYFMIMSVAFSDSTDLKNPQVAAIMEQSFRKGFPQKKVTVDGATNSVRIAGRDVMFAIRDAGAGDWMFLGYDRSNPKLLSLLYPRQVRQYFKVL